MLKRGIANNPRRLAKNFITNEAQKRLNEVVQPFNQQALNALGVDAVEVIYYSKMVTGISCSCEQSTVHTLPHRKEIVPGISTEAHLQEQTVRISSARKFLFGEKLTDYQEDDTELNVSELISDDSGLEIMEDNRVIQNILSGGNIDCGVCYRTGYVPGYQPLNKLSETLAGHNIKESSGYYLNTGKSPNLFEKLTDNGFVSFLISVPKYFNSIKYSIRNNREMLWNEIMFNGQNKPLNLFQVKEVAGKELEIRVCAKYFTHLVIEFDLGVSPVKANLAGETYNLDYTLLETLGNLQVILPWSVYKVNAGDILLIPSRNMVLKVTDVTKQQTATMSRLEWSVNTRMLQPQETLRIIGLGQFLA